MRKDVLIAISLVGVCSAVTFWATRHPTHSSLTPVAGISMPTEKTNSFPQKLEGKETGKDGESKSPLVIGKAVLKDEAPLGVKAGESEKPAEKQKVEIAKKVPTCFQADFQIAETDIPQILDLGKDIQLNSKTVCVRVNGNPAVFHFKEKAKNQIIIGSLHESKNDVKVSYCVGVSKCSDPCVVKQDRFLAALGGEDDLKANGKEEGVLSAEEQDLEKELASFQALRLSKEQKVFLPKQVTPSCQKDAS